MSFGKKEEGEQYGSYSPPVGSNVERGDIQVIITMATVITSIISQISSFSGSCSYSRPTWFAVTHTTIW
jgi:hypothetical protein